MMNFKLKTNEYDSLKQYYWLVPLTLVLAYSVYISIHKPIGDFGNYYYGSKFLINGNWGAWIYEPIKFNLAIYNLGERNFFLNYTPVPPLSSLLYLPFTFLNPHTAKLMWNILNSLLFLFTIYRLQKTNTIHYLFWCLIPLIFFIPIRNTITEGQSYFLLLFLLAEGYLQYSKGRLWLMALLWAFAIHLKISPAIVLLFLVFNKDFKAAIQLMIATILLLIISIPFLSADVWIKYIVNICPRLLNGEINSTYAINYQSAQVLLKTLLVPDLLSNTEAGFNQPALYKKFVLIFKLVILGASGLFALSKTDSTKKFSMWLICSLLVSGYGNSFSMLLLVIPAIEFYSDLKGNNFINLCGIVSLLIAVNIPFYLFSALPIPLRFPRLYALIMLFAVVLITGKIKIKWWYFFIPLVLLLIPLKPKVYEQNYFLKKEEALLIYDFSFDKNLLSYNYFDNAGPQTKSIPLDFEVNKTNYDLTIFSEKSCVINDSILVYLSDENRGVGFYTLRTTNITKEKSK